MGWLREGRLGKSIDQLELSRFTIMILSFELESIVKVA